MRDSSALNPGIKRIFLVDCNSFFVSCEQLFNPKLIGKPVVVLSNNDGCVVSRSPQAKALGIGMGVAAFKIAALIKQYDVKVLSSNFSLYADMSARVMQTLAECAADIEVYSIDEAFLSVSFMDDYEAYAKTLRARVKQYTGIPVSIGIAQTKTLAKVANALAKKHAQGVFDITVPTDIDSILASFPVGDVWGVGYRYNKMLLDARIRTAKDLKYSPDAWIRKKMTIMGLRTVQELRGISCIGLVDQVPAKQSITVSRSFGRLMSEKKYIQEAVANYVIRAAQKLRREKRLASVISVYITTSRFHDEDYYFNTASFTFSLATSYTPDLLKAASVCLDRIFKKGYQYKKAGILLHDLVSADHLQLDLFKPLPELEKQQELMKTCDKITARFGTHTLSYVSAGTDPFWKAKRLKKSPHYTTNWHELLKVGS